ncbi:SIR2 family protein [Clostridium pasteurianum]|uniref:SIR2 family protein n=1 Tax=Clostridium pasteurianum TaxID=1501 RepID=UPI001FA9117A|nr:SIR2 family protein [Clostridium pasteurianum]
MEKNNTTYILGAGFNQCIKDINGLKPPLSTNFFNTILKNKSYNYLNNKIEIVYEYIYKYWKKSKENLIYDDFDLEECFTLLQLQLFDAYNSNNQVLINKLLRINSTLKFMFIENLCEFEYFSKSSDLLLNFASLIYKKSSNIITFNYDRNLEKAIEAISHNKWKSFLSYGVKFDTIRICSNNNFKPYTENNYSSNSISSWNILKLHGSLNWFKCIYENNYSLFKNYKSSASYKKPNLYWMMIINTLIHKRMKI